MVEEMILENSPACEIIRRSEPKTEDEFREARTVGLGGSDAGAILGLSTYKSPFMVACEKMKLVRRSEDTDATRRGKKREPWLRGLLADWFFAETGKQVKVYSAPGQYRSKRNPIIIAQMDGFVDIEGLGLGVLEIKTAIDFMMPYWENDQIPDSYYAQGQHYALGTDLPYTLFFAEVGDTFLYRISPRNQEFIDKMEAQEVQFWNTYIVPKILPDPAGIEKEEPYLLQLYGKSDSEHFIALPDLAEKAARYLALGEAIKPLEAEKDAINALFKGRIGNAKGAAAGAYRVTWSRFKRESLDTAKLKVEEPKIWQKYRKESDTGRLTISLPVTK